MDQESSEKGPREGRSADGRFAPGNTLGTPFGPENPPPKSPGRPRKDAWLGPLEEMLAKDGRLPEALAGRLMKIALKGRDSDALKALELIQTRVAGPVKQQVEAEIKSECRRILICGGIEEVPPLPDSVLAIERAREEAENRAQIHRGQQA